MGKRYVMGQIKKSTKLERSLKIIKLDLDKGREKIKVSKKYLEEIERIIEKKIR